jgi:hypothetical protein
MDTLPATIHEGSSVFGASYEAFVPGVGAIIGAYANKGVRRQGIIPRLGTWRKQQQGLYGKVMWPPMALRIGLLRSSALSSGAGEQTPRFACFAWFMGSTTPHAAVASHSHGFVKLLHHGASRRRWLSLTDAACCARALYFSSYLRASSHG